MFRVHSWVKDLCSLFTLYGGSDGGGGESTSTNYNTSLPEYARPYYEDLMRSGKAEKDRPYIPYTGQRVQGFAPAQLSAFQNTLNLGRPDQFALAQQGAEYGAQQGFNTQKWIDPGVAESYMNPYMQNVTDIQKREATRQAGMQNASNDAMFARSGAFGGSRQGVVQAELQRNLMQQQNDIQAQGLNQAWQQGQQTFGADRSAQQAGIGLGLQGSQLLGQLGEAQQATDLARIGAQQDVGAQQQALGQQARNVEYEDFINQRDFNRQNLNFYSGLLQGVPVSAQGNTIQYQAQPSMLQQASGAGLAGLGLYQAMNQ